MKTILLNEGDNQNTNNGGGAESAGQDKTAEQAAEQKGTPAEDNADATGKATEGVPAEGQPG